MMTAVGQVVSAGIVRVEMIEGTKSPEKDCKGKNPQRSQVETLRWTKTVRERIRWVARAREKALSCCISASLDVQQAS